jgi:hypothetical protein
MLDMLDVLDIMDIIGIKEARHFIGSPRQSMPILPRSASVLANANGPAGF